MKFLRTQIGNCRIWSGWKCNGLLLVVQGFPCGLAGQESACNAGDLDSIPSLGRSPREGKSYPLQYSGLGNSIDCIVHGVTKSRTWLSDFHFCFINYAKAFDCVDHKKLWKALKEMEIPDHLTCLCGKLCAGQEASLEPCMEQLIGSRLRKEYNRAVCSHPVFFNL